LNRLPSYTRHSRTVNAPCREASGKNNALISRSIIKGSVRFRITCPFPNTRGCDLAGNNFFPQCVYPVEL
jgi:hypothetical protein